ncbi:MAG: tRNA (N6-threonylcarbamoyladenosine(37)-N6)-methyltransferase TrmO [Pseudomonadota bacterium]
MKRSFKVNPIGVIRKTDNRTWIEIEGCYKDALWGLEGFSHIHVLYWFHENDTPELRGTLQVHPRKDPNNPLTGVFATHSPMRPNLIALTLCRVLSIQGTTIEVEGLDARDGSPLIDIKCYIPYDQTGPVHTPVWV